MHTWALGYGYAGGPVCGCLIKRNLSQVVPKACRQPEGAVFRNGPFAKGGNSSESGQFETVGGSLNRNLYFSSVYFKGTNTVGLPHGDFAINSPLSYNRVSQSSPVSQS